MRRATPEMTVHLSSGDGSSRSAPAVFLALLATITMETGSPENRPSAAGLT